MEMMINGLMGRANGPMEWTRGIGYWDWYRRIAMVEPLSEKLACPGLSAGEIQRQIIGLNYDDNLFGNIQTGFRIMGFSDVIREHWDVFVVILEYLLVGNPRIERGWTESEFSRGVKIANGAMIELLTKINSNIPTY